MMRDLENLVRDLKNVFFEMKNLLCEMKNNLRGMKKKSGKVKRDRVRTRANPTGLRGFAPKGHRVVVTGFSPWCSFHE